MQQIRFQTEAAILSALDFYKASLTELENLTIKEWSAIVDRDYPAVTLIDTQEKVSYLLSKIPCGDETLLEVKLLEYQEDKAAELRDKIRTLEDDLVIF
jgi:hypothetical protein